MKPDKTDRKAKAERTPKPDEPSEAARESEDAEDTDLGYAEDAGHPGGKQDLDAKTESEDEHDSWGRHG